jgi:membrane associated rhomboid family serine protease
LSSRDPSEQAPAPGVTVCYRHPGREANIRCQRCSRPICPDCMRDAAVGFQCPDCVKEGAKATRSGRTAYGGTRSANPALTSQVLVGLNLVVWLGVLVTGWTDSRLVARLALVPTGVCESIGRPGAYYRGVGEAMCQGGDGRWVPGVADGAVWQLLTSTFLHVQVWHVAANMLALYLLGPQIEAALGRARFLALYLVSGLAGSATVYWLSAETGITLGASGAIYGLFAALAVIVHKVGGDLRSLGVLLLVNLVITFAVPNISWQGHLGGFVGGALITALLVYAPKGPQRARVQWAGVGLLVVLLLAAVAVRTAVLL